MNHAERLAFTERLFGYCEANTWDEKPRQYEHWLRTFTVCIGSFKRYIREDPNYPGIPMQEIISLINQCLTLAKMVARDTGQPEPDILGDCLHIMRTKGLSYASAHDAAENFKRNAVDAGVSKYTALLILMLKHVYSIDNCILNAGGGVPTTADGESIFSRLNDLINYLTLCAMMQKDDEREAMQKLGPMLNARGIIPTPDREPQSMTEAVLMDDVERRRKKK